jgi:hypothetical protein
MILSFGINFRSVVVLAAVAVLGCGAATLAAEDAKPNASPPITEKIRVSDDGTYFVFAESGKRYVAWGFNYLGDEGKLLEEQWEDDWANVETDFREMRKLGANVVRIHLQVGTYMTAADKTDAAQLERLGKLLDLARQTGVYVDVTGLGCYHLDHIPAWYDELSEAERWNVQANFWEAIAKVCAGRPEIFCYDLMNEPVIGNGGAKPDDKNPWLGGELGNMYFVQRISKDPGKRSREEIAEAWVAQLTAAIRKHDGKALVTVGAIPWAQMFPGAKPLFYAPQVAKHLDFVSVHFYPKANEVEKTIKALRVYDIGKPMVVEETFPLSCGVDELDQFIDGTSDIVDGWISHYFGKTIEEHKQGKEFTDALMVTFLKHWQEKGKAITGAAN